MLSTDVLSADADVVSKLAELDMVVGDLERANSRVAAVERRNVSHSYHAPSKCRTTHAHEGFRNSCALKSRLFGLVMKEMTSMSNSSFRWKAVAIEY